MVLISGICYANSFDGFQKRCGVNIQAIKDRFEVDVLLLRLCIMTVFGQDYQIAIIPLDDINIPLQAIGRLETDNIPPETDSSKAISATEYSLMSSGVYFVPICHLQILDIQNYGFFSIQRKITKFFVLLQINRKIPTSLWLHYLK